MVAIEHAIVGRDEELAKIDRFLGGCAGETLLLEGEPGIGKTTLWRTAVSRAAAEGARVLTSRPAEAEAKLSHAALADLVGSAYDEVRDALPEPQRRALDAVLLRATGTVDARTTGSALVSVLAALAEREPVVVAIDDIQWLDRASLRALEFAARRLPEGVRLLLARRSGEEGASGFVGARPAARVVVGPLSVAALHHVLAAKLGAAPPRPLLTRIAATSGGNPFFALEIARFLAAVPETGEPLPVPPALTELVAARLDALTPAARDAALVASALARPTVGAVGASPAALADAEAAGVLVVERDRIRFTHPLLASAVYGSARGAQRLELHRRLADTVDDPEERASHLALAATDVDEAAAAEIEAGAAAAAARGAPDAAADLFRAAQRLTPRHDAAARARRLRLESAALLAAGSPAAARTSAEEAVRLAPAGTERAEALLQLSQASWVDRGEIGPIEALRLAVDHASDDRILLGRVHAKLGIYSDGDQRLAHDHAQRAASLLDEEETPGLLAYALLTALFFGAQTGNGADERLLERALELERRAGPDGERSSLVLIWYECTDRHDEARERHRVEDEWYRDRGDEIWRAEKRAHRAVVEFRAGNWELARELVEKSCAELEPVGNAGPLGMPFWTRARFDALAGRTDAARATLLPLLDAARAREANAWFTSFPLEALGVAALADGDAAAADRAFTECDELLASVGVTVPLAVRTDAYHVEALVALGELDRARAAVARFEQRAASVPRPWTRQALPRAQALVAAADGDVEGALALLEAAPVVAELPFERAQNLLALGSLRRRLRQRRAAAEALSEALGTFERLGAPAWAERARAELDRVGLRRGDRNELTETERRIAELAASGLTNREVAQAAFVSPKTVEANLARVYRKLGIRSRAELGAAMARAQT